MLRQQREALRRYIGEAAFDAKDAASGAVAHDHLSGAERGHERLVPIQYAEVAFGARRIDLIDLAGEKLPLGRD